MAPQTDIIIVGGGLAGLLTAKELAKAGNRVVLLEAAPRLGGRVLPVDDPAFNDRLQLGAEFVHGDLPITLAILKEAGIAVEEVTGARVHNQNGAWTKESNSGMHKVIQKMNNLKEDMPFEVFLDGIFEEDEDPDLRNSLIQMARGFDLADTNLASTKALAREWNQQEDKNYRPQQGYGALVNWLEERCRDHAVDIRLSAAVQSINWQRGAVQVETIGETFYATKVILTVPISMLQFANKNTPGFIEFTPPLTSYQQAADDIGFGTVIKIFLRFEKPFWQEQQPNASFIISNQMLPAWWTQAPGHDNILTGWLGGPGAKALHDAGESILLKVSLQSLSGIFNISVDELSRTLTSFKFVDWTAMPFVGGGYSYATVKTEAARKILQQPVEDSIYFAGEAIYESTAPGTVEAALHSAITVASSLL